MLRSTPQRSLMHGHGPSGLSSPPLLPVPLPPPLLRCKRWRNDVSLTTPPRLQPSSGGDCCCVGATAAAATMSSPGAAEACCCQSGLAAMSCPRPPLMLGQPRPLCSPPPLHRQHEHPCPLRESCRRCSTGRCSQPLRPRRPQRWREGRRTAAPWCDEAAARATAHSTPLRQVIKRCEMPSKRPALCRRTTLPSSGPVRTCLTLAAATRAARAA